MDNDRNELIRARAYEIWEREGRPAGHESEHWRQAELELEEAAAENAASSQSGAAGTDMARDNPSRPTAAPKPRQRRT
jgi:hypothetical protein